MAPILVAALDALDHATPAPRASSRRRLPGLNRSAQHSHAPHRRALRTRDQGRAMNHRAPPVHMRQTSCSQPHRATGPPFDSCRAALPAGLQLPGSEPQPPSEVAAPIEVRKPPPVESTGTGRCGGRRAPAANSAALRDLQGLLPLPAMGRQLNQGGVKVSHPVHQDRPIPWRWSASSASGGPSVSWIAATLVPIASTIKTTRPPRTSVKYQGQEATSRLGACTRSRAAGRVRAGQSRAVPAMRARQEQARAPRDEKPRSGGPRTPSDRGRHALTTQ